MQGQEQGRPYLTTLAVATAASRFLTAAWKARWFAPRMYRATADVESKSAFPNISWRDTVNRLARRAV